MKEVKQPKKPLIFYYLIVILALMLFNALVMPWFTQGQIQEVDYGTFMDMTKAKEIGLVEVQDNQILFTDKDETTVYKTGVMFDPGLVDRLDESGATFSQEIVEEMSPLTTITALVDLAHGDLHRPGTVYEQEAHEQGWGQRHDVRHGQVQCQDLCQFL